MPIVTTLFSPKRTPLYEARLAVSTEEIQAAQRLRFEVFNMELQEGLVDSHITGLDQDPFDAVCDHLIVIHRESQTVIGTYRMQTGTNAGCNLGYYSEQEFDFAPYEPLRHQLVELGRACIHRDHRNLPVLNFLWSGIAHYAAGRGAKYLIGCSSLSSLDPALAASMSLRLKAHQASEPLLTRPWPEYSMPAEEPLAVCPQPPKLLRAYLSMGAKLCGPPALDRNFGTIDFLTLMDLQNLPQSVVQHFGIRSL